MKHFEDKRFPKSPAVHVLSCDISCDNCDSCNIYELCAFSLGTGT